MCTLFEGVSEKVYVLYTHLNVDNYGQALQICRIVVYPILPRVLQTYSQMGGYRLCFDWLSSWVDSEAYSNILNIHESERLSKTASARHTTIHQVMFIVFYVKFSNQSYTRFPLWVLIEIVCI